MTRFGIPATPTGDRWPGTEPCQTIGFESALVDEAVKTRDRLPTTQQAPLPTDALTQSSFGLRVGGEGCRKRGQRYRLPESRREALTVMRYR